MRLLRSKGWLRPQAVASKSARLRAPAALPAAGSDRVVAPDLACEHFLQPIEHRLERGRAQGTEPLDEPFAVNGPQLIEDDMPLLLVEATGHAKGIWIPAGGHRGHDHRP